MTTNLAPYPSYRTSDIEWIDEVPSHWQTSTFGRVTGFPITGQTPPTEHKNFYLGQGAIPWYGPRDLRAEAGNDPVNRTITDAAIEANVVRLVSSPAIIVSIIGSPGKVRLVEDGVFSTNQQLVSFPILTSSVHPRFLSNLMLGFEDILVASSSTATIAILSTSTIRKLQIPLPPLDEQRAIADYLDRKDAEITRFIESRRRMIALLEEKKQAIINQAVTRGLDPSVPMKDSGVEWLGEIPAHWEVRPNRFLMRPRRNPVGGSAHEYTLLSLTLNGVIERDMVNPEGKFPTSFETYQEVKKGDFILCLFDIEETPRCVGLSRFDGMITGAYDVLRPVDDIYSEFLYRYYLAIDQRKALKPAYRGLRNTIRIGRFLSFGSPVPPVVEMTTIIQHINEVSKQIDRAVQLHKREMELMQEYRTRLISDVVTGKAKVK